VVKLAAEPNRSADYGRDVEFLENVQPAIHNPACFIDCSTKEEKRAGSLLVLPVGRARRPQGDLRHRHFAIDACSLNPSTPKWGFWPNCPKF
jgi:hypothetical protein